MYRFSGIIVDVAYDHFLSKNWNQFSSVELTEFINSTYELMKNEPPEIDNDILIHFRRMRAEDWLSSYSSLEGIDKAFKRISARLKRKNSLGSAVEDIVEHYSALEKIFLLFFPELIQQQVSLGAEINVKTSGYKECINSTIANFTEHSKN